MIGADGHGLRRLTPEGVDVASYEWAPDGNRIAYRTARFGSYAPTVRVVCFSRGARRSEVPGPELVSGRERDRRRRPRSGRRTVDAPDRSPRGDEIAYGDGSGRQRIIHTDGSKPLPFLPTPGAQGFGGPTWSADGTHVGFVGGVRRGRFFDRLHLVTSHAYKEYGFAWWPDGWWILYGRAHREGIYVIGADGRDNHRVTRDSPRPVEFGALTWAPDGRSIAYATDRTGNGDIYVIGADGHDRVRLTSSAASDADPAWQHSRTPCCP